MASEVLETRWIGEVYIAGPSDPRFRSLQGDDKAHRYNQLDDQLRKLANQFWILGANFNSHTGSEQVG